jgi:hypothetical protein
MRDFSLFGVFLKNLPVLDSEQGNVLDPSRLLKEADIEQLKKIFRQSEGAVSSHSFAGMMQSQSLRLKHSLISCSTAQTLAENSDIDPVVTYACALMRQLGHNLIAWNYPRIYSRVIGQVSDCDEELEKALLKVLGFSPANLVQAIAEKWQLAPEMKLLCGMSVANHELDTTPIMPRGQLETVLRFCKVGETMAKVNDPEHYPSAAFEWNDVVREVTNVLGPQGLQQLNNRYEDAGLIFKTVAPALIDTSVPIEEKLEVANSTHADIQLASNSYALRCPPELQEKFRRVYRRVLRNELSTDALELLLSEVIPAAGFTVGCIYIVDTRHSLMVPTIKIGDTGLGRYKPLNCSYSYETGNSIVEALLSQIPIRQEGALLHGERVSHISGMIGTNDKPGVLYLEMSKALIDGDSFEAMVRFRAIARCVSECLGITGESQE